MFALGNGFFQNPLTVANLAKISKYDDFEILIRQPPTFPGSLPPSIIGRLGLNRRVRYGNGCVPQAYRHRKCFVLLNFQNRILKTLTFIYHPKSFCTFSCEVGSFFFKRYVFRHALLRKVFPLYSFVICTIKKNSLRTFLRKVL